MVTQKKGLYQCDECKLFFKTKELAQKCEAWCSTHNSCNLEIARQHVKPD